MPRGFLVSIERSDILQDTGLEQHRRGLQRGLRLVCSDNICAATCSVGAPETLQQILQRRVGLVVAFLGIVERNLGAGELARNVGGGLLVWRAVESGAEALLQRRVLQLRRWGRHLENWVAANTARLCTEVRRPCSFARAPYPTTSDWSPRASADKRGSSVALSPVYQATVLAVPSTNAGRRVERRPVNAQRRVAGVGVEELVAGLDRGGGHQLGVRQGSEALSECRL